MQASARWGGVILSVLGAWGALAPSPYPLPLPQGERVG